MAQRPIREYHAKKMLANHWEKYMPENLKYQFKAVLISPETDLESLPKEHPWLTEELLVAKPDQLFGKRGKHGLVFAKKRWDEVKRWIEEKMNSEVEISGVKGRLTHFIVEPFVEHDREYYLAMTMEEEGDRVYASPWGGIYIEENWDKVKDVLIPALATDDEIDKAIEELISSTFTAEFQEDKEKVLDLSKGLYRFFRDLHYTYLELNPFTFKGEYFFPMDTVARLDDTAAFLVGKLWGDIEFPAPFGRVPTPEEKFIKELDEKSGASLKLTVLNPDGVIWTLVAGGGASVVYADTIADLGYAHEMATYGEYSGNPSTTETYLYAKTILDLMTRKKDPKGRPKILLIGGAIANFTDVAKTFDGIIMALREYADKLKEVGVKIYVRRGGPNYQTGLKKIKEACEKLGLPIEVYGPELHMTNIVRMAIEELKKYENAKV